MTVKTIKASRVVEYKKYQTTDKKEFNTKQEAESHQYNLYFEEVDVFSEVDKCKTVKDFADLFNSYVNKYGNDAEIMYAPYEGSIDKLRIKRK